MIPTKIIICGVEYAVVWKPDSAMRNTIGEMLYNDSEIWLNEKHKHSTERMMQVFLHEVVHAVSEELNLELTENQVNNLAVGLYPIVELR